MPGVGSLVFKGALVAALAVLVGVAQGQQPILRVSAIPDEAPTELQRKFAPLGKYLEAQTGMKVIFTPVSDYAAVVESLATRKIDLAWLGGFTFVQARIRTNGTAIPIAQREEDAKFTSKFITARSEEHTSELQSQSNLVCRLLLEKKKYVFHVRHVDS